MPMDPQQQSWITEGGPWAVGLAALYATGRWWGSYLIPKAVALMESQHAAAMQELAAAREAGERERSTFREILEATQNHYLCALTETHNRHAAEMAAQREHDAERHQQVTEALARLTERVDAMAQAPASSRLIGAQAATIARHGREGEPAHV